MEEIAAHHAETAARLAHPKPKIYICVYKKIEMGWYGMALNGEKTICRIAINSMKQGENINIIFFYLYIIVNFIAYILLFATPGTQSIFGLMVQLCMNTILAISSNIIQF